MEDNLIKREILQYVEKYRYRLVDQQNLAATKSMDLGMDRILKDCELYITLFGFLIAGLAFVYSGLSGELNFLKILFFGDFILIGVGLVRAFSLRQRMIGNLEKFTISNADLLKEEIEQLAWENGKEKLDESAKKWLDKTRKLYKDRRVGIDNIIGKYKVIEKVHLKEKSLIFSLYGLTLVVFITILGLLLFK